MVTWYENQIMPEIVTWHKFATKNIKFLVFLVLESDSLCNSMQINSPSSFPVTWLPGNHQLAMSCLTVQTDHSTDLDHFQAVLEGRETSRENCQAEIWRAKQLQARVLLDVLPFLNRSREWIMMFNANFLCCSLFHFTENIRWYFSNMQLPVLQCSTSPNLELSSAEPGDQVLESTCWSLTQSRLGDSSFSGTPYSRRSRWHRTLGRSLTSAGAVAWGLLGWLRVPLTTTGTSIWTSFCREKHTGSLWRRSWLTRSSQLLSLPSPSSLEPVWWKATLWVRESLPIRIDKLLCMGRILLERV